jgi:hypothetical protein
MTSGVSGDMAVAALLALRENSDFLLKKLSAFQLEGFHIDVRDEQRNGISGKIFTVRTDDKHPHPRNFGDIQQLIESSSLHDREKTLSLTIFRHVAEAESKVHGVPIEKVHFHEVGALDSIIDIVSFSVLYLNLGVENSSASKYHFGQGSTASMHGVIPVPAPATVEITRGLPVKGTEIEHELTTPTGAAIVKSVAGSYGPLPSGIVLNMGTGFGTRKTSGFNALRVFELEATTEGPRTAEQIITVLEVTIDDSTPEEMSFLQERLFSEGALDVFFTPIYMKKNRPAFNITILCSPDRFEQCANTVLLESSTFGIRYQHYRRKTLERHTQQVLTKYGTISVKIGMLDGKVIKSAPEYEDMRAAAHRHCVPLQRIVEEVRKTFPFPPSEH